MATQCSAPSSDCKVQCGGTIYPLSLVSKGQDDLNTTDVDSHSYFLRGCGMPLHTCEDSQVSDPIAVQSWGDFQDNCASLGSIASANCSELAVAGVRF